MMCCVRCVFWCGLLIVGVSGMSFVRSRLLCFCVVLVGFLKFCSEKLDLGRCVCVNCFCCVILVNEIVVRLCLVMVSVISFKLYDVVLECVD